MARIEADLPNGREGILDLVASRVVIDIVGDAGLVGRVEDDEIHGIETNTAPAADAQSTAGEVMDHCNEDELASCKTGKPSHPH